MRIRARLLILVLSILIPAFLAAALAVWYVYTEERKAQERSMAEAARAFALLVDSALQTREGILRTLAISPSLAAGDIATFYRHAKTMAPTPESTIILSDLNGRQLMNTRLPLGAPLPTRRSSNMAELMQQYGTDRMLVSDLFMAPVGKRYDFTIQVPVKVENELRYSLVMGINAAQLDMLWKQQHFPAAWIGTIVDRQGVVVARSRDPAQYVGKTIRDYSRRILAANREGSYPSTTLEGIAVSAFFSRVPSADWSVLISIPVEDIRQVPTRAAAFLAAMMVLLLVAAVLAARWLARRAIKPIEDLRHTAQALGQGREVVYVPQGVLEVDAVGATLADAGVEIERGRKELERRVAEAVAATEKVQRALLQSQKLEALGRLTGGIAHEFNNLLQTLTTALQLAEMASNEPRVQALIETCNKAVDRANALTGQLKSFGRVQDASLKTISVREQIDDFVQLIRGVLPSDIKLDIRLADDLWPVTVDALQFELALLNIAINARDAMPDGGSLRLEAGNETMAAGPGHLPAGDYVRISIADTGTGMSEEVLAKALDPFFTTKAVGDGTGLGLPQAYGFATQSHGTLVLGSVLGQGSTVVIYLPKAGMPVTAAPVHASHDTVIAHGTVLFVEDDALVREAVVPALERAGFRVVVAHNGKHALSLLDAGEAIDVLFSDVVMPGDVNGIELAGMVRTLFPDMKIVLATGYTDKRVSIPGVQLLAKPYDLAEVVALLARPVSADIPGA